MVGAIRSERWAASDRNRWAAYVRIRTERRNRGYTLYRAGSGTPVARLRPTGQNERVEVLYWSLWKERGTSAGPFGRTILPIDEALRFIASEDILRAAG